MKIAQMLALAVLVGSLPIGYIIVYAATGKWVTETGPEGLDIRCRVGMGAFIVAFVLSAAKGFIPVYFAKNVLQGQYIVALVGVVTVLAHCFPYWFMFRPMGKGITLALGTLLALNPAAGTAALVVWLLGLVLFNRAASAVVIAAITAPLMLRIFGAPLVWVFYGLAGAIYITLVHLPNLARIINGTEPKLR